MTWRKIDGRLAAYVFAAAVARSVECGFSKADDGTVRCGTDLSSAKFHDLVVEARLAEAGRKTGLRHVTRRQLGDAAKLETETRDAGRAFFVVMEGEDVAPGPATTAEEVAAVLSDLSRWSVAAGSAGDAAKGGDGAAGAAGEGETGAGARFAMGADVAAKLAAAMAAKDAADVAAWLSSGSKKATAVSLRDMKRKVGRARARGGEGVWLDASGVALEYVRDADGRLAGGAAYPYVTLRDRFAAAFVRGGEAEP